jgi:LuxR family transcriptional regulator, maltose regulon positive regulatory protein
MDTTTLITKVLLPRRRDDVLTRQRLLDRLYDMVDYKLVLLSAPAGYGKSTLLVDFAADLEHPVCWYALDASDHDPYLFLQRLVMSLRRHFPDFGEATLHALEAGADLSGGAPGVVRILVNEIVSQIPRWFVVVLDDYHALGQSPEVDAILSNFVVYQRDQCLTILASRTVPNLPLIIPLVARGGVGGIGHDEMRFTPEEVQALFAHHHGTELTLSEATALAEQSEGWVTGLLLTAYMRLEGVLQNWMRARNSNQPVYDYLAQEVFDEQPAAMQRFLVVTSTLSEMNARLCEEILGIEDAQASLDAVEARNLFVSRFEGDWFRYHHLFRDFLQGRLRQHDPELWAALHRQAARWYGDHGRVSDAVRHTLAVGDEDDAAGLMTEIVRDLYVEGRLATLMTWRAALSTTVLEKHPRLALYLSRVAYKFGDREASHFLSGCAEHGYRAQDDAAGLAYALLQRCEIWLPSGELQEALALGQEVLAMITAAGAPVAYEAHRVLGRIYVGLGDLSNAHKHLRQAVAASQEEGGDYAAALTRTSLAQCLGRQGRLEAAIELNREAVAIWRRLGSDAALADELNDLGFHLYLLGTYPEALRCFQESLAIAQQTGLREVEAVALVDLGEMARDLGCLDQATGFLERGHALASEIGDRFVKSYSQEALGLVYRIQGRLGEAREAIQAAVSAAAQQGSDYQLGRYRASLGAVLAESGDSEAGLNEIGSALAVLDGAAPSADLYRARLLEAWVHFLGGAKDEAVARLGELLDHVPQTNEVQVFVAEGKTVKPLYDLARKAFADTDEDGRLKRLRAILRQMKRLATVGDELFLRAAPDTVEARPALKVFGFGRGQVALGDHTIPATAWGSVTARHLLFYMLIHGSRSREQIADDFWPELTAQKAKATFHTTKFRLHHALGRDVIDFDGRAYSLDPELDAWFDVAVFRERLRLWRSKQDVGALAEAVALYEGDFLTDCYLDWCVGEREALRVQCLESLEALADRLMSRRQYRRAVQVLRQALTLEPARETFHQQLMRAYALSGQRSRALAQYERCRVELDRELGAAPSQATDDLYERILREAPLR